MNAWLWISICLNLALTSCSLWLAITVRSGSKDVRRLLESTSTRSLKSLDGEVTELAASLSSISATVRRLSSRIGMQDVRARRKEESVDSGLPPLTEAPSLRKAKLREGLAKGTLQVVRDGHPGG